jgi:hypothetical protein
VVDPEANLVGQKVVLKIKLPHHAERGADQTEIQLKGNAVAAW